ncbi:DUF1294 domain-containing protein [Lysinibacillus endophyticus]|uniref:DUF1294 domain-containing protein n=1 Tax=Ureibacillus endophyticus TaxID=1978490 RepID=A0A494ZC53_9BACL|nr:DUF1294 domain-containing protein [Lysinibacillus endophyticus]MCP1145534.1 DUF1294 domain-containing protein [Lysinibacillus endophyticus]RKQ20074.1 DUF1294 domain-containing protein [Lysinibacillus endophyticus]
MDLALISYIAVMSIILCIFMYIDKSRAKNHEWRISEKSLFTLAILGGACGGVLGMYLFRHKTKHNSFAFGFPLLAAVHIFLIVKVFSIV